MILATGILVGMLLYRKTGYSPGGILSPGLAALDFGNLDAVLVSLSIAFFLALILELLVRRTGLFGRQRIAAALVMALALRLALSVWLPVGTALSWLGWVVPGLVAADMQRQGVLPTAGGFLGAASVTFLLGGMMP